MPTKTYQPIATTTVSGSSTATITFNSLGSSYNDLIIVGNFGTSGGGVTVGVRFNSDSGSNYSTTQMNAPYPYGSSWRGTSQTSISAFGSPINVATSGVLKDNGTVHIQNYNNSTTYKTILSKNGWASGETLAGVGLWRNTNAITSVSLVVSGVTFLANSTFTVYGIL
jgi:hypothetical protein